MTTKWDIIEGTTCTSHGHRRYRYCDSIICRVTAAPTRFLLSTKTKGIFHSINYDHIIIHVVTTRI